MHQLHDAVVISNRLGVLVIAVLSRQSGGLRRVHLTTFPISGDTCTKRRSKSVARTHSTQHTALAQRRCVCAWFTRTDSYGVCTAVAQMRRKVRGENHQHNLASLCAAKRGFRVRSVSATLWRC